jgi:hypothetical protein
LEINLVILSSFRERNELQVEKKEILESHVSSRTHAVLWGKSMWFEEVGCQAHGLKKQVVKHVSNSLQVREIVGEVISPGGSPTASTEL